MEEPKGPNSSQEKKQVVVNIGKVCTHGGGGIGGVILLGGALATAAFASAFIFGKKKRGGSRDNSHRKTHIPPPAAVNKKDGRDIEANEKECSTFLDANNQSSETIEKIELKDYNQSLVLYEKHGIEINGVAVCDSETGEQILCSINPKRPENGAISNGGVSHLPAWEEKTLLPLEIEETTVHDAKIQSSGEAAIDENGVTEECKEFEEVEAEGEGKGARENELTGEIQEVKCEDTEERNGNYVPKIGLKFREGTFVPEQGEDGQESSFPVVGSPISKGENVNDDEKQDHLSSEVVEIIHDGEAIHRDEDDLLEHIEEQLVPVREKCNEPYEEIVPVKGEEGLVQNQLEHIDEAIQQDEEDQLEHIEEHLIKEREICNEPDEEIVSEKGEEDQQCEEHIEEKGYVDNSTPENRQLGDSDKEDVQNFAMHLPEDEPISPEEMEVSEDDAVDGENEMSFCQHKDTDNEVEKNIENEVEDSSETIDTVIATAKDEEDITDGTDSEEDLSDEAGPNTEGSVETSMESNLGGVWPAEAIQEASIETQQQQKKLLDQEMEGKIQEDATMMKQGKYELHPNKIIADNTQVMNGRCNSAKTFIERHVADLATLKDYSTNSGTRKVLLAAIPVLSSISCSWFFGLSFDKFCFVVLLTIVLSKSMIVK